MRAPGFAKLVVVVFIVAMMSGCAKAKAKHVDPDPYAQPQGFDEDTGSVVGTVVDEEFVPLKDAIVGFIDPYQAAKTNEAGRFEIGLLDPGKRNLYVIHLGHQSAGKAIEIKIREATEVLFILKVLPIEVPWVHVVARQGHFSQSVRIEPIGTQYNTTYHNWFLADKSGALEAMVLEAAWSQQSSLAGGLRIVFGLGGAAAGQNFLVVEGQAPLRAEVDRALMEETWDRRRTVCVTQACVLTWSAAPATNTTRLFVDVGIMMDQRFEVFVSHFYRMLPPPGYTVV
jgi:hypothetical protein